MGTISPPIQRASPTDRAMLAMDLGGLPQQIGVVLLLESPTALGLDRLTSVLAERIRAVPRLRQRLIRPPLGCGGPIWVDDAAFDIHRHVREIRCRTGVTDSVVTDMALDALATPLPRDSPLWSVLLISGAGDGRAALVIVMHHVLADGRGGLAILRALADPGGPAVVASFPVAPPGRRVLAAEAWSERFRSLRRVPAWWADLRHSMNAAGGVHAPRIARCSLLSGTGPNRRIAVVTVDEAPFARAARQRGATTNDAVLVAVAAAVARVLGTRGEDVTPIVVVVPVAGHARRLGVELGNVVAPLIVPVPTHGPISERLSRVTDYVRSRRDLATSPPPVATLGWVFRPLAAAGAYRWYMNHQRRFHTLVTHVRGPRTALRFGGVPVVAAVPMAIGDNGNVPVTFSVMSHAGHLTVAIIADPDHFAELDALACGLREALEDLSALS